MVGAVRSSSDALNYELLVRDAVGLDFYSEGYAAWTGTGFLTASLPLNAVDAVVQLDDTDNLDTVIIGGYALIDSEFVKVKNVDTANEQVTIARGVLDSVPAAHSAGARIMFLEASKIIAVTEYASGALPAAKILSRTGKGEMEEADAPTDIASAFNSRQARAYPPGNFKVNAVSYPASFTGQPTLSWSHRDRTQQVNSITEHSAASIGPETSTTYTIKIYDEDNVLRRTVTGLTGTSYEYTEAFERADCGLGPSDPLNTQLRFVLYSVRSGLDSWQSYDITVPRA
jgi:hypothetical protein